MCSILGIFGLQTGDDLNALRRQALERSQRQRHRGPDWSGVHVDDGAILVHERLAIVDPAGGAQPLRSADGDLVLAVNGEIYNHRELEKELTQPYDFQTGSDCEVINALYRESLSRHCLGSSSPPMDPSSPRRQGPSDFAFNGPDPSSPRTELSPPEMSSPRRRGPSDFAFNGTAPSSPRTELSPPEMSSPRRRGPSDFAFNSPKALGPRLRGDDDQERQPGNVERPGNVESGLDQDRIAAFLNRLNGIFAFALWDRSARRVLIARDPMGVCPLYWGHDREGRLCVASEMKALAGLCADVAQFPPGHYFDSASAALVKYYDKPWRDHDATKGVTVSKEELRDAFERAVHRQMMTDVPYGVLLSGGLDSSLVAACAARFARRRVEEDDTSEAWWPRLHSFAIGLEGSPDLAAAEVAAEAIGTVHHGYKYTFEEGLDALPEVIRHIETYDVTTIRASTPMYLLARRIKAMGVKMVLSGEGSDEIFGGYLYFHKAPNAREFHEELVRKLDALHNYDCLRANKSMMAWGVEPRVPFLDVEFLDVAMRMDAQAKMVDKNSTGNRRMEKAVLREAFEGYLPDAILWRQKEQFSDGVGYGWIDGLKAHAEASVSDREFAAAASRFPFNPPQSKEAYLYRRIFEQHFPDPACAETVPGGKSIACSSPAAIAWDASFANAADPSGRAIAGVHQAALVAG